MGNWRGTKMGQWEEGVRREGKGMGKGREKGRGGEKGMREGGRVWEGGRDEECGKGKWDGDWWEQGQGLKPRYMKG